MPLMPSFFCLLSIQKYLFPCTVQNAFLSLFVSFVPFILRFEQVFLRRNSSPCRRALSHFGFG